MRMFVFSVIGLFALSSCFKKSIHPQLLVHQKSCVENLEAGDFDRARVRCELCLEYDKSVPECLNGLGLVAMEQGDDKKASEYFSKALRQANDFAQARNNLGAIHFRNGEFTKALPLFQSAVKIDPRFRDARYNLGLCNLRLGQRNMKSNDVEKVYRYYDAAEEQLKRLIEVRPEFADAYRDLGLISSYRAELAPFVGKTMEYLNRAEELFSHCLLVDPDNESCHESFGHASMMAQKYDQALYYFVGCLATNKDNTECIRGMDSAYAESQLKSEAMASFIEMIRKDPRDARGHFGYCQALFASGLDKIAARECEIAAKLDVALCPAHYQLAMHYKKILDPKKALASCHRYLLCKKPFENETETANCRRVVIALGESS